MKNFVVVLRNVGAVFCIGVVVFVFFANLVSFFWSTQISAEVAYDVAKSALGVNFLLSPFVIVGNALLMVRPKRKLMSWLLSAVCGAFSAGIWGFLVLFSGCCTGRFPAPLALFILAIYGGIGVFYILGYFSGCMSGDDSDLDDTDSLDDPTICKYGHHGCEIEL